MKLKINFLTLSATIILVFIFQLTIPSFTDLFVLNQQALPEIWRFLTSIFLHGDPAHLVYNLFALLLFGLMLQQLTSESKLALTFFITGILANLFSYNFYNSSLGASGAIFGIIGALIIIRPTLAVWAFGLPMPIFIAGILWAAGDLIGAYAFFSGNPLNNTGNLAHLSGMFFGFILGFIFRRQINSQKQKIQSNSLEIPEGHLRHWENHYMKN